MLLEFMYFFLASLPPYSQKWGSVSSYPDASRIGASPRTLMLRGSLQVPSDHTFAILADRYGRSALKTDFDIVLLSLLHCYVYASFYWHHVLWNLAIFVISDVLIACFLRGCRACLSILIFNSAGSVLIHFVRGFN